MKTINQYKEKLSETCILLSAISKSAENNINYYRIYEEMNGYLNDLPYYRVLQYQLYVDYFDIFQKTTVRDYCVDADFFNHDFNLIEFNNVYIYSGLISIQKNIRNLIYRKLEKTEVELLNLNVVNKKIVSAYHFLSLNDFQYMLKNIIDNLNDFNSS